MKYAVIDRETNKVVNVIKGFTKLDDRYIVTQSFTAEIGDRFDSTKIKEDRFIKPVKPEPELPPFVPNETAVLLEALKAKVTQGELEAARQKLINEVNQ